MSHIVSIQTQIRDRAAVEAACTRLHWPAPVQDTFRLFTNYVEGLGVQAPRWRYPIVCDLTNGHLHYDNFEGRWGEPVHLDQFKQAYAIEKAKLEARRQGRSVTETPLSDGSVQLVIELGVGSNSQQQGGDL
jgi:hypothetical protein